ncbi:MAG TPA: glycosyl hydrolase [Polyangiaceae bacterium]|nr:glycosyl hydrolase [Polyangiaceae bacterium]
MIGWKKQCLAIAAVALVGCGSNGSADDGASSGGGSAAGSSSAPSGAAGSSSAAAGATQANAGASSAGATSGAGSSSAAGAASGGASSGASGASSGGAGAGASGAGSGGAAGASSAGSAGSAGQSSGAQPFKGVANSPCAARTALNVSWYYNWEQTETEPCTGGAGGTFVPMIWGHTGAEQTAASIQSAVAGFVSKGYKYVLGFNEPDNTGQSNISVATAITLLPSFDNAAIAVGTPATQANTTGQAWFKDYMGQVAANTELRADFIALHWYGWNAGSCDAQASQLESYIKYAEGFPGNRPIWLTEWGCLNLSAPTTAGVVDFYKGAVAVFAKHPRVVRYAWYPWSTNCGLNNSDGTLTDLGVAYAAQPATK